MVLLILGLALIVLILIVVLYALHHPDIVEIDLEVIRPWKFHFKFKKDKHVEPNKNE